MVGTVIEFCGRFYVRVAPAVVPGRIGDGWSETSFATRADAVAWGRAGGFIPANGGR